MFSNVECVLSFDPCVPIDRPFQQVSQRVDLVEKQLEQLQQRVVKGEQTALLDPGSAPPSPGQTDAQRLQAIEAKVRRLQRAV